MSYYNWQLILKNKTEDELIRIYSGDSMLDNGAGIYARLELKNREYDF